MPFPLVDIPNERVPYAIFTHAHLVCIFLNEFVCFCSPLFRKCALCFWNSLATFIYPLCLCFWNLRDMPLPWDTNLGKLNWLWWKLCPAELTGLWASGFSNMGGGEVDTNLGVFFCVKEITYQFIASLCLWVIPHQLKSSKIKLCVVAHRQNPSTWEAEGGWLSWVQDHPGIQTEKDLVLKQNPRNEAFES